MHTLYWSPGACSIAPHIVLEEIGDPYATKKVAIDSVGTAETLVEPAYLEINRKGRVPAMTVEGGILTEAPAIMDYLARAHPQCCLLPPNDLAQARVHEWMNWLATSVHAVAFAQIVRPQRFVPEPKDFAQVTAKGRRNVAVAFAFIEQQLRGKDWAVAGQYSLADIYLLFFYLGARSAGNPMEKGFPAWTAVAERTLARPAVQRVIEHETAAV
ncbi:MAG TPA: glutathione binding-like protein [Ramlibacter sp.]|nr:glutathione binding-like protein [Ramlibacter sp.]